MSKAIKWGVLVLFAGGAYVIGTHFSSKDSNPESTQNNSSFERGAIEDIEIEGMDLPEGDPDTRGRVVSVAKDHMIISRSIAENTLSEQEREEKRTKMQSMSDQERQAVRAEKQAQRDEDAEQVRITFSDDVKIVLLSGETAELVTYDKIAEDANVSIWTSEGTSDVADTILVSSKIINQ